MSDQMSIGCLNIDNSSETSLHRILKNCANFQSSESLLIEDFDDVSAISICDYYKMMSSHSAYSTTSGNNSTSSYAASDESFGDNILEENGRISLAYENLRTIPKRLADKFAAHTKCLDLSYNNFENLTFLSFFEALHTLILDRNERLDINTLPYLPNLKILWINNCGISKIVDWIQRIQVHCPILEQLSIMGNPGIKSNFNICHLDARDSLSAMMPYVSDYREYILVALPNLDYLDGVARCPSQRSLITSAINNISNHRTHHNNNNNSSSRKQSTTTSTTNGIKSLNGNGISNMNTNGYVGDNRPPSNRLQKNTPTLKELFRLRRRKKSYQSSSTN